MALDEIKMQPPTSFFLPGRVGNLFAMYYPPAEDQPDLGDVLYVHPFAGEMFAARNVIAACARELASCGRGVLTIDLYGCGDSSGDFSDARWDIWHDDLAAGVQWLQAQGRDRLSIWGLRLGALLAMDFAVCSQTEFEYIILWQPVVSGRAMLTQFFRMNLDEADHQGQPDRLTDPALRSSLGDSEIIEVAGYGISPTLVRAIDKLELSALDKNTTAPIEWVDFAETADRPFAYESSIVLEDWKRSGVKVNAYNATAKPFWLFPHCCDPKPLAENLRNLLRGQTSTEKMTKQDQVARR